MGAKGGAAGAAASPVTNAAVTPMLAQYLEIKGAHPDCLLFYRMGDFYEMFFDDAVAAAGALDITLTKRGRHDGDDIPMCGVPVHSHESYLERLIRHGFRVAICEQTEDPAEARKRGAKAVVQRAVVRIVTPGTLTEDSLLEARAHNYLAALAEASGGFGLGWIDLSTGTLAVQPVAAAGLASALARLAPSEVLVSDRLTQQPALFELFSSWKPRLAVQPASRFNSDNARRRLLALYGVGTLDGFGPFSRAEIAAAGALVDYVEHTQKGRLPTLLPPLRVVPGSVLEIDPATRRNLEVSRTLDGSRAGSLLGTIDRTVTGGGARLLAERLAMPLTDRAAIIRRLDMIGFWIAEDTLRQDLRHRLRGIPDLERALARLGLGRGGPRDLAAVRDGLAAAAACRTAIGAPALTPMPEGLAATLADIGEHSVLVDRLTRALAPDLPLLARDGGFIARSYAPQLDELVTLRDEGRRLVAGLQAKYAQMTGVASLKVKHNNVLGFHIEVSAAQADKLMTGTRRDLFIHRQTTANSVRFSTVELGELERDITEAAGRALAVELELFNDLVGEVAGRAEAITKAAGAVARLDVTTALADLAVERRWCRPDLFDDRRFAIRGGRHPVVEAVLVASGAGPFVANDCDLGPDQRLWLVTGPNMAGKSTFLRQNALIAILAQMGSFVPADSAGLGVVDRLFSRVGAADDLARGQSTFMVEMVETATILNQASSRSLVILDEIGRGTATFDGLSIAWACVEHLHDVVGCRALFATHFHELTHLREPLAGVSCRTMRIKEWHGDVVFLHEVVPGAADRSYGLHVARLAGLPKAVVGRAQEILDMIESGRAGPGAAGLAELPLFASLMRTAPPPRAPAPDPKPSAVDDALRGIDPDDLTPRQALDLLFDLRRLIEPS